MNNLCLCRRKKYIINNLFITSFKNLQNLINCIFYYLLARVVVAAILVQSDRSAQTLLLYV